MKSNLDKKGRGLMMRHERALDLDGSKVAMKNKFYLYIYFMKFHMGVAWKTETQM